MLDVDDYPNTSREVCQIRGLLDVCEHLCDGINDRLGVPIWVEVIGQWRSDHTASIPLVIEEGKDVSFASTLGQNFPRGSGNLQLLASLGLIASHDLVEGLDDYE